MKQKLTPKKIRDLLAHSSFWTNQLEAHPEDLDWLLETPLDFAHFIKNIEAAWRDIDWSNLSLSETFTTLRRIKRCEMLRITVRDLTNEVDLRETVAELSALADFCLQRAFDASLKNTTGIYGEPKAQFAIFGMGKLGGQELNYSSDIDLIFVYSEEGIVGRITHHDFFTRVAETIMQCFRSNENGGSLFRVDLRLRPEGNSGPITRSLESYENYYAAFGDVWERMALQKARIVAGDQELGYEFVQHLQSFCFPKYLPTTALDEIFEIKGRIEAEILKAGGLERHVKLGRGGIREIEFSVQALQLLHGARNAFSQERGTLKSIQALQRLEMLTAADAQKLTDAYIFLRRLEHRLQMQEDRQTHMVPEDKASQTIIAKGLGYKNHQSFDTEWKRHIEFVRTFFHGIVRPNVGEKATPESIHWSHPSPERDALLKKSGFKDPDKAAQTLHILAQGPEYAHVSQRTCKLFDQLCPHILKLTPSLTRPDFALEQFERFIEVYGSRAALYELLASNPKTLELIFKLFDYSHFLTDILIKQPALLDAVAFEGLILSQPNRAEMEAALAAEQGETLGKRLRQFRCSELLRIGLRDISGLATSLEETCSEISQLADVCLSEAVKTVLGARSVRSKSKKTSSDPTVGSQFCVVALGKYGGQELSYGSDLDVLFIGGTAQESAHVIASMSQEQNEGVVFKMDTRLRPDGSDGPLTIPLEAYSRYYKTRAQFWERQALTRARVVAGDQKLGKAFLDLVDDVIYSKPISKTELKEMTAMRKRIENERGDPQDPARDFKTGAGGLIDVEFLAQAQQLIHGPKHPSLRRASTLKVLRAMPAIGNWKQNEVDTLIEHYLWLRELESLLRCLHNTPTEQLPASRSEWDLVARHLEIESARTLESEMMTRRKQVRKIVEKLMRL
jgi:[glutamine synthetase] adenylyltransferase / [glutamine synthetase]-adenylyl-L-tyrosine phosphorylase